MISDRFNPLNVAVVGCGYWGPNYIRNFSGLVGAEVRALCDPDQERRRHLLNRYPGIEPFDALETMLKSANVDAVVIATPVHTHYELAKACLQAGKHVLLEKPMASSSTECDELIALADASGLTLVVGHTFLYSEPIRHIKMIIERGDIGEVLYINSQRLNLGLIQKDINVAWDLAPHDLSIILHLLGKVPSFVNCQGNAHVSPEVEDVTNMSLRFDGGQFATIQCSWLEPRKVRQMTIVGTRGMVAYDDLEPHQKIRIYDTHVEKPPHYDSYDQFHYSYHYGDCFIPHLKQEEPLKALCRHFLECIVTGCPPRSPGLQGAQLVRILEACSRSLKSSGAPVAVEAVANIESEPRGPEPEAVRAAHSEAREVPTK